MNNQLCEDIDQRLWAFDFDGTLAMSFEKSLAGMCVERAYQLALKAMFGDDGFQAFVFVGGLKNRAPRELLQAVVDHIGYQHCLRLSHSYFDQEHQTLSNLMPVGKGIPLSWNTPDQMDVMTELFVRTKLRLLFDEIGRPASRGGLWPCPMEGVTDFFRGIEQFNSESRKHPIDVAILSSGHQQFIERCFVLWGLTIPKIIVTDDDLRPMKELRPKRRVKPNRFLLWYLLENWARHKGDLKGAFLKRMLFKSLRGKVVYFGDDPDRDGRLARKDKVPFFLYDPQGVSEKEYPGTTVFQSWGGLTDLLLTEGPESFSCG